jgi:tetratricopeptide (TPR) repeat protein
MRLNLLVFFLLLGIASSCQDENSLVGDQYFEAGNYEKAIDAYNDYLKLKPRHVKTIYNRGRCYQELGQYDKAMEDFNKVIKLDGNNENALLSIGQEMYRREDYKSTVFYCEKVLEKDPNNAMSYYLMGRANHKQGHTRTALNNYSTAINLSKDFGEAYLYRGALNLFLKRKSAACNDLQQAVKLKTKGAKEALAKNCK